MDARRANGRSIEEPTGLLPDMAALRSAPYVTPDIARFRVDFDQALRGLPEADRDAFILTELRGLAVREAANLLGISKSEAATRAEAARIALREELM